MVGYRRWMSADAHADARDVADDPSGAARSIDRAKASSVGFLLSKLGLWSARRFAERLDPLGLEPRHAALLREIARAEGRSQQELAEGIGLPASRIVALVDDLEAAGLVERRPNPRDRRAHAVTLTARGREVMRDVHAVGIAHEAEVTASLSSEERRELVALLVRLAEQLDVPLDVHPETAASPEAHPPGTR